MRAQARSNSISSCATAWRCIGDLEHAGRLEGIAGGLYALGPAIVEMDRQIRIADPLIEAASDIARGLSQATRGTILLCRLYGLKVICVHSVAGSAAPAVIGYERGRAMPLYRGVPSRAILAHLPARTLQRAVDEDAAALRRAGWPTRLPALQQRLQGLREQGVQVSVAEVDERAHGWAVPLFARQQLIGSLGVVREHAGTGADESGRIGDLLRRSALRIEGRLEACAGFFMCALMSSCRCTRAETHDRRTSQGYRSPQPTNDSRPRRTVAPKV